MSEEILISPELLEKFLEHAMPQWMRLGDEEKKFQSYVLRGHASLENLINALLAALFFGETTSPLAMNFQEKILAEMDFAKKVVALRKLGIVTRDESGKILKINDFRIAQAHPKKDNPLTKPDPDNFSKAAQEALGTVTEKFMYYDRKFADYAAGNLNAYFKSKGIATRVTADELIAKGKKTAGA